MEQIKQWKDLFNNSSIIQKNENLNENLNKNLKNNSMTIKEIIESNNNGIRLIEKIPQSVIKKSIKIQKNVK